MTVFFRLLKALVVGGLLFLVPVILLLLVAGKAIEIVKKIVGPLVAHLPVHSIRGIALATLASAIVLLLIAMAAGLVAQTRLGRRFREGIESAILGKIPAYSIIRGMLHSESFQKEHAKPALAWIEESWVYAFVMESHEDGTKTVFIPGAPNPLSGSIYFLSSERVKPLDVPFGTFVKAIRGLGIGSIDVVSGKLSPPT